MRPGLLLGSRPEVMSMRKTLLSSTRSVMLAALAAAATFATFAMGGAGCSGGGGGEGNGGESCDTQSKSECFDYACYGDGKAPAVAFKTDVLPIMRRSCGTGGVSCHGMSPGTDKQPFLGVPLKDAMGNDIEITQADIDLIFEKNVDVVSFTAPTMKVIAPGSPATSFLMHKMDDSLECSELECTGGKCGLVMPYAGPRLEFAERDIVRRWIAQGAKND
jgi:hypothetical protein